MESEEHVPTLEEVMDRIAEAGQDRDAVTVDAILDAVGQRSFGPALLLVGLIVLAPIIGDIPGVPTLCALMVFMFSIQLMLHREHFWLPQWMLRRYVKTRSLNKAIKLSRKPARFIDRLVKPRLTFLIRGYIPTRCVALASMAIALMMPPMEFIPFSANLAGAVLTCFGLALIARDGVLALIAFTLTGASATVVIYGIWG
ncbi:exopolysaccharide biosynthesis protein [Marinimicrobium locisalis]|uniref:exopolysaccharide biosynthesis protein n=1 Tax=Marinimicrobium locisalis TaxID=546022 RepID=UPI0032221700